MIFVIDILVELHQELADHLEDHAGLGQCRQLLKKIKNCVKCLFLVCFALHLFSIQIT